MRRSAVITTYVFCTALGSGKQLDTEGFPSSLIAEEEALSKSHVTHACSQAEVDLLELVARLKLKLRPLKRLACLLLAYSPTTCLPSARIVLDGRHCFHCPVVAMSADGGLARSSDQPLSTSGRKKTRQVTSVLHNTFGIPAELNDYLTGHGVDTSSWGTGDTKNVEELFEEIRRKESTMFALKRCVRVLRLVIRLPDQPLYHLVCYARKSADSCMHECSNLPFSKMTVAEVTPDAAARIVLEEFGNIEGIKPKSTGIAPSTFVTWNEIGSSLSYPALMTQYQLQEIQVDVPGLPGTRFSTVRGGEEYFWEWRRDSADDSRHKSDCSLPAEETDSAKGQVPCIGCRFPTIL